MSKVLMLRRVSGTSMQPTLKQGRIVVASLPIKLKIGDVVIANVNKLEVIKRVSKLQNRQVYILGDNQSSSTDSRQYGWIDQKQILAKVIFPRYSSCS